MPIQDEFSLEKHTFVQGLKLIDNLRSDWKEDQYSFLAKPVMWQTSLHSDDDDILIKSEDNDVETDFGSTIDQR